MEQNPGRKDVGLMIDVDTHGAGHVCIPSIVAYMRFETGLLIKSEPASGYKVPTNRLISRWFVDRCPAPMLTPECVEAKIAEKGGSRGVTKKYHTVFKERNTPMCSNQNLIRCVHRMGR